MKTFIKDDLDFYNGREVEILSTREIAGIRVHWVRLVEFSDTGSVEMAFREEKIEYREAA